MYEIARSRTKRPDCFEFRFTRFFFLGVVVLFVLLIERVSYFANTTIVRYQRDFFLEIFIRRIRRLNVIFKSELPDDSLQFRECLLRDSRNLELFGTYRGFHPENDARYRRVSFIPRRIVFSVRNGKRKRSCVLLVRNTRDFFESRNATRCMRSQELILFSIARHVAQHSCKFLLRDCLANPL